MFLNAKFEVSFEVRRERIKVFTAMDELKFYGNRVKTLGGRGHWAILHCPQSFQLHFHMRWLTTLGTLMNFD